MADVVALQRKWLLPLIFFEIYLSATVFLFFYGPWTWEVENPLQLAGYLIAAQVFIAAGYMLAWRKVRRTQILKIDRKRYVRAGTNFLKRALAVTFLLLIPTSLSRTGNFLPDVFGGLSDAGAAYDLNFERLERGNPFVLVEYLRILLSPMLVAVIPLAIVYWQHLSGSIKIACLIAIGFNLSLYVATGTNKGVADLVITLPWLLALGVWGGALKLRVSKWTLLVTFALFFVAFLWFFGIGQLRREGGLGEFGVFDTGFGLLQADTAHVISSLLSDNQRIIFESLTRYVGQGYYALSLSFDIEHSSTLGLGNSMFLARNADAILGTSHFTWGSIPGLLERSTGWGMFTLWHSIYPWFASDVGFSGTLVVLGALSYIFGLAWGRSLTSLAPQWVVLSYLLLILFFYIPANNQIFQSGESCFAFLLILLGLTRWRSGLRVERRNDKAVQT